MNTSPKAVNSGQTEREAFKPVGRCECTFSQDECEVCESNREAYREWQMENDPSAAAPQGLTDEQREAIEYAVRWLDENVSNRYAHTAAKELRALLAEQSAAPMADDAEDDEIQPTPESERAAFNAMMRWHLIRLLQAWRYGGDLRGAGMAAFELARTNNIGKAAFEASERAVKIADTLPRASEQADEAVTHAARDVLAERKRQVTAEGWSPEHDDVHTRGELSRAAACYATNASHYRLQSRISIWPWSHEWWKPTTPRRDLVKAGALILAEIERLDRAARAKEPK